MPLRPGRDVGEPDDRAVGAEDDVPALVGLRGICEPVVDVGADEGARHAGVLRELAGELDRLVADVDAGHFLSAEVLHRERVLSRVALEVQDRQAADVAEDGALLRVELDAAVAEELRLVHLVAVVGLRRLVP